MLNVEKTAFDIQHSTFNIGAKRLMSNTNELILLQEIRNALGGVETTAQRLTPTLEIVTTSGTIAPGAKFVSIGIKSGSGTILGTPVDTVIRVVEFPYVGVEYDAIDYTLAPDSEFIIVVGR